MALLNYSTEIEVETTITEITKILVGGGARAIRMDYDGAGNVTALIFQVDTPRGSIPFKLPADPRPVMQIINEQVNTKVRKVHKWGSTYMVRNVPKKFKDDMDQARRVAWRILKDWVEAQMALVQIGMVQLHQVFLPYAVMRSGRTFFEMTEAKNMLDYQGGDHEPSNDAP